MHARSRFSRFRAGFLALALALGGLSGWLHPAVAAGSEICSAGGTRWLPANPDTTPVPAKRVAHDCAWCASAAGSAAPARVDVAFASQGVSPAPAARAAAPRVARRDFSAEPRAPPALS
jgi:hypothetical protein